MKILGLIPARGGSKGIPRKNIAPLAGKPLLAWTVETAGASGVLDRLVVSTDDPEIAEMARRLGAETPFIRPAELARDDTPGVEPALHAVSWLRGKEDYQADLVLLLQPTSPLRSVDDIRGIVESARREGVDAAVSVTAAKKHPFWMRGMADDGRLIPFMEADREYVARQQLPPLYAVNGALYLIRTEVFLAEKTFFTDRTYAYIMPEERSLDIDSLWDLHLAELILRDGRGRHDHA